MIGRLTARALAPIESLLLPFSISGLLIPRSLKCRDVWIPKKEFQTFAFAVFAPLRELLASKGYWEIIPAFHSANFYYLLRRGKEFSIYSFIHSATRLPALRTTSGGGPEGQEADFIVTQIYPCLCRQAGTT